MKLNAGSGITLTLLFIVMLTLAFNIQQAKAIGTICIRADGSVDPDTAPISSVDNITYTFTDNIFYREIFVERDNIVVDGAGYTVQGTGSGFGITLLGRSNVTIKNIEIKAFDYGITLSGSSNNIIQANNVTANNIYGIRIRDYSSNNSVSGNDITNNYIGIWLYESSQNSVYRNDITNNTYGIRVCFCAPNNKIYHNNFVQNWIQAYSYNSTTNVWDDGYPSGGNYWSDYSGVDLYSGCYQNETGSDGIGDTPYVIDENNTDRYPLMEPYLRARGLITNVAVSHCGTLVNGAYKTWTVNVTVTVHNNCTTPINCTVNAYYYACMHATWVQIDTPQSITDLHPCNTTTLTFNWNLAGLTPCTSYTMKANATIIDLVEINPANDEFINGQVYIRLTGDTNNNGFVGSDDIIVVQKLENYAQSPPANPYADVNGNGFVGSDDIIVIQKKENYA